MRLPMLQPAQHKEAREVLIISFIPILSLSKDEEGLPTLAPAFPAKAGIQIVDSNLPVRVWVPACAGKVG